MSDLTARETLDGSTPSVSISFLGQQVMALRRWIVPASHSASVGVNAS